MVQIKLYMCRRLVWEDLHDYVPLKADWKRLPWPTLPPSLEQLDLLTGARASWLPPSNAPHRKRNSTGMT